MLAPQADSAQPFYLSGNFAPVLEEVTAFDLPVEGSIPPDLRGVYLRNGPNPKQGDLGHWFFGDGMLHGVRLEGGQAKWYRNRWVRTRALEEGAEFLGADGSIDYTAGKANTNILAHAGRILALVENALPTEVTAELDTVGICDFGGKLNGPMTAHPKICPQTGELHFFGYGFFPPYVVYHVLDRDGRLVRSEPLDVRGPTMMHDFALTERHVVFMDLPIVFDLEKAIGGEMPYAWSDDYGARLGILPRGGTSADVKWVEIEPCYVFHPANAFERDGELVIDVARYPRMWDGNPNSFAAASLHRWRVNLHDWSASEQALDDRAIEFPRIDDRLTGRANRYAYAVAGFQVDHDGSADLVRYDLLSGAAQTHDFGAARMPGEGVFVPVGEGEDEGFVLAFAFDQTRNGSDLVIIDAADFAAPPVARIELPQRVPFGFHGNWVAQD